jgi:MFS family permease
MNNTMIFAFLTGSLLGITFLTIPPALDVLMELYAVSYIKISTLISALFWSHALMQMPAGMLTDRVGLRRTLIISLSFMCFGGVIPAAFNDIRLAIIGRMLTGIGTGLSFVGAMKLIAVCAPTGRIGTYQSFFACAFSGGSILAYMIIPRIIGFGWQRAYLLSGLACLPLIFMLLPMDIESHGTATQPPYPMRRIIRIRIGWIIGLYHALSYGTMINLGNWVPTLLSEVLQGTEAAQYAWGGVLVFFISGLGRIAGGFILFRCRPLVIANGSILILFILFVGLFLVPVPAIVFCLALLAAWFASINFGAIFHIASGATAIESLGSLFGFINFLANLGAILFIMTFGSVKDTLGSVSGGFGVLAMICLVALLLGIPSFRKELIQQ